MKNLNGNVKSIREIKFTAIDKFGEISKRDIEWDNNSYTLFNNNGNLIELSFYNSDGCLDSKVTYKYDDNGNKIEWNSYNSDGSLDEKYTAKYDDKGIKSNFFREVISVRNQHQYFLLLRVPSQF